MLVLILVKCDEKQELSEFRGTFFGGGLKDILILQQSKLGSETRGSFCHGLLARCAGLRGGRGAGTGVGAPDRLMPAS